MFFWQTLIRTYRFTFLLTLFQPGGGGGGVESDPLKVFLTIAININRSTPDFLTFKFLLSRNNSSKNQVHNLSGDHMITLLLEALCFTTYLSLYLHRIFKFYFFFFLTFIFSFHQWFFWGKHTFGYLLRKH